MKCRDQVKLTIASTCASALLALWGVQLSAAGASAQPPAVDVPAVLKQAKDYQMRYRDGDLEAVAANVALLESATTADTGNADLWYAMGLAYVTFAARAGRPDGNRADAMVALQKGMPALNRALQIKPDHAETLSLRAGMQAMLGKQMNAPQLVSQAIADMNRAVELAPDTAAVRLVRAFAAPSMPEELRNRVNEAADLDFLMENSERNRARDYISILRADLLFENDEVSSARQLYEKVDGTGASSAANLARSRLALLPQGRDPVMRDIKALRAVVGTQCSMCHGREDTLALAR